MANRSTKKSLERFKYEVADELGVPLSNGYNGDLTAKQNGSVGGYMVKKMIEAQERQMAGKYPARCRHSKKKKRYQRKRRDRRLPRSRFMCEIISSSDSVPA